MTTSTDVSMSLLQDVTNESMCVLAWPLTTPQQTTAIAAGATFATVLFCESQEFGRNPKLAFSQLTRATLTMEATEVSVRTMILPEVEDIRLDGANILHNLPAQVPVAEAPTSTSSSTAVAWPSIHSKTSVHFRAGSRR